MFNVVTYFCYIVTLYMTWDKLVLAVWALFNIILHTCQMIAVYNHGSVRSYLFDFWNALIYSRIAVNIWYCCSKEHTSEIFGLLILLSGFGLLSLMRSIKQLRIFMALFKEVFQDIWMFTVVMMVLVYSVISAWSMSDKIKYADDPTHTSYSYSNGMVDIVHFAFGEFDQIDEYY
jgi:hypothetical protein